MSNDDRTSRDASTPGVDAEARPAVASRDASVGAEIWECSSRPPLIVPQPWAGGRAVFGAGRFYFAGRESLWVASPSDGTGAELRPAGVPQEVDWTTVHPVAGPDGFCFSLQDSLYRVAPGDSRADLVTNLPEGTLFLGMCGPSEPIVVQEAAPRTALSRQSPDGSWVPISEDAGSQVLMLPDAVYWFGTDCLWRAPFDGWQNQELGTVEGRYADFAGFDAERVWVHGTDTSSVLTGFDVETFGTTRFEGGPGRCHDAEEQADAIFAARVWAGTWLWTNESGCLFAQQLDAPAGAPIVLGTGVSYDDDDFDPLLEIDAAGDRTTIYWLAGDPEQADGRSSDDDPVTIMAIDCAQKN